METKTVTPGPMFSMTRADALANMTGYDSDFTIRFLEAHAEKVSDRALAGDWAQRYDLSPLGAHQIIAKLSTASRELDEIEAEAKGELWTMTGFMAVSRKDGPVLGMIFLTNGRRSDDEIAAEAKDYPEDHQMGVGPNTILGDRASAVAKAASMLVLDIVTVHVVNPKS